MKALLKFRLTFFLVSFLLMPGMLHSQNVDLECSDVSEKIDLNNEASFDFDPSILGNTSSVCFINGRNTIVNITSPINALQADLVFHESCENTVIQNLEFEHGVGIRSTIISEGQLTIDNLQIADREEVEVSEGLSLGLSVRGPDAFLDINTISYVEALNSGLKIIKVSEGSSFLSKDELILSAESNASIEVESGSQLITEKELALDSYSGAVKVTDGRLEVAGGLSLPRRNGTVSIKNATLQVGQELVIGRSTSFSLDGIVTVGANFNLERESMINISPGAELIVDGSINPDFGEIEPSPGPYVNYIEVNGLPYCAKVTARQGTVAVITAVGDNNQIKLCDWPATAFFSGEAEVITGECPDCSVPTFDNASITGVNVGDKLTLTGRGFKLDMDLILGSTEGQDVSTSVPYTFIDEGAIQVTVPIIQQTETFKINDEPISIEINLAPIVLTEAVNTEVQENEMVWVRGSNLQGVNEISVDNKGDIFTITTGIVNTAQDSIGFITPKNLYCSSKLRLKRKVINSEIGQEFVQESGNYNLFETPSVVTNPHASGTGTLTEVLSNVCDNGTITFDPSITTFAYDEIRIIGDYGSAPKNITITGNGKANTILIDSNKIPTSFTMIGMEDYLFEDMSFINTVETGEQREYSVFNLNIDYYYYGQDDRNRVTFKNVEFKDNSSSENAGAITAYGGVELIIENCVFTNNTSKYNGGAISTWDSRVKIINSIFNNNTAILGGGAIYARVSPLEISGTTFSRGNAENGGAIYSDGLIQDSIANSFFINNSASKRGGALAVKSDDMVGVIEIFGTTFRDNKSDSIGGAIFNLEVIMEVDSSTIKQNTSTYDGGGIFFEDRSRDTDIKLKRSMLNGNVANRNGGALYTNSSSATLFTTQSSIINNIGQIGGGVYAMDFVSEFCTWYNNVATETGGALFAAGGKLSMNNSTVYKNSSENGGAIHFMGHDLTLVNNAIGENIATSGNPDLITNTWLELKKVESNCFTNTSDFVDHLQGSFNIVVDLGHLYLKPTPLVSGLQTYFEPYSFSPLIDNAKFNNIAEDQLGNVLTIGELRDIGAVEVLTATDPMRITTTDDDDMTEGSIRSALIYYNYHYPADTMTFDLTVVNRTILLDSALVFELLLDPAGNVDQATGAPLVTDKFLYSDGTGITLSPNSGTMSGNNTLVSANSKLLLSNFTVDGFYSTVANENFERNCINLNDSARHSKLDGLIVKNCEIGIEASAQEFEIVNSFIYSNTSGGIKLESNIENPSINVMKIHNNVIGLDENMNSVDDTLNHKVAGVVFVSGHAVFGGNGVNEGNVVAGNVGTGVAVAGESNTIVGNFIGVLKDGVTIIPNERSGVEFLGGDSDGVSNDLDSNIIAGSPYGVLIPSPFHNGTGAIKDNNFYKNLFIATDTAILIQSTFQGGIEPPTEVGVVDSVISGKAEPLAEVQIFMDSTGNVSFFVDIVTASNTGDFTYDLKNRSDLPSFEYITTLQTVATKGSSALSEKAFIGCEQFNDLLIFADTTDIGGPLKALPKICGDTGVTFMTDIELSAPYLDDKVDYQWFIVSVESEPNPFNGMVTSTFNRIPIVGQNDDTLRITKSNGSSTNLGLEMKLENGCVIESNNVVQEITSAPSLNFAYSGDLCVNEGEDAFIELFGGLDSTFVYYSYKGVQTKDTLTGMSTSDPLVISNIATTDTFFLDSARTAIGCEVLFTNEEDKQLIIKLNPTIEPIDPAGTCDSLIKVKDLFVYDEVLPVQFLVSDQGTIPGDSLLRIKQLGSVSYDANVQDGECYGSAGGTFKYFDTQEVFITEDTICGSEFGDPILYFGVSGSDSVRIYYNIEGISKDSLVAPGSIAFEVSTMNVIQEFKVDSAQGKYCPAKLSIGTVNDSSTTIIPTPKATLSQSDFCDPVVELIEIYTFENATFDDYEFRDQTGGLVTSTVTLSTTVSTSITANYVGSCSSSSSANPMPEPLNYVGFDYSLLQDTVVLQSPDQQGLVNAVSAVPVDSIVWSSSFFTIQNDTADIPVLTNLGEAFLDVELVNQYDCIVNDSIYVSLLGVPVAVTDSFTIFEDIVSLFDVLANDTNTNNTTLIINSVSSSVSGAIVIVEGGEVKYTPELDFVGEDILTYEILDGYGKVATGSIVVTVEEQKDPLVLLALDTAICSTGEVDVTYTINNFIGTPSLNWEIQNADTTSIAGGLKFSPTGGDIQLSLEVTDGVNTIKVDTVIKVQDISILESYTLSLDNDVLDDDIRPLRKGGIDTVFTCQLVETTAILGTGTIISWDRGNTILNTSGWNSFIIEDENNLCSISDSVFVKFNSPVPSNLPLKAETGQDIDTTITVEFTDFARINSVLISPTTNLLYGEVSVNSSNEMFSLDYIAKSDSIGVTDTVYVEVTDVCGTTKNVTYEIELKNTAPVFTRPILVDSVVVDEEISEINDVIVIRDKISKDINNNITKINLINKDDYPYLRFDVIKDGNDRDVSIEVEVIGGELPDSIRGTNLTEVNLEFNVCDVFVCSDTAVMKIGIDLTDYSDIKVIDDVIQLSESNKKIRDSLDIAVINSAVTNNVGLKFEFKWDNRKIDVRNLEYELIIISRWGDVVYQDFVEGENVNWHGEYQERGSQEKVGEGNYQWVIRARYVNNKGKERFRNVSGNLYYVNIESQNIPD